MKLLLSILSFLMLVMTPAHANTNDDLAIDTIQSLYNHALQNMADDFYNYDEIRILYQYADKDLQSAIKLVENDDVVNESGALTDCHVSSWMLHLINGNGQSLDEASDIQFTTLRNGDVRALIFFDNGIDIKDYEMQCDRNECVIKDTYDIYGDSALQHIMQSCHGL